MGLGQIFRALVEVFFGPSQPPQKQETYPPPAPPKPAPPPQQQRQQRQRPPAQPPSPPRHQDRAQENAKEAHYQDLRARASDEHAQMGQCFEASKAAYAGGERARAKELSNEGKAHQSERDRLNAEASEWIFAENNRDRAPGEVDLHGLHVKEAITFTDREIKKARRRGDAKLRLIVGKGLHSPQGMAKLKPAIEEMMQQNGLLAELDENNAGVLIVDLDGRPTGAGAVIRPDDIARKLANKEDSCIVM